MMKNALIAAMVAMTSIASAQQTLTIIDQDYEMAKQKALQQKKLLIVDFYTTWCVPCKMLDNAIFKNDSIAHEIDKNFVVLRYDAEKDAIHNLSLKHHVCSYPTTLVLTAEGKVIHKMFGTGGGRTIAESYANLLSKSLLLNRQGKYIPGVSTTIDPDIYPAFYKKYVRGIADIKPDDLSNYWAANKDLQSEVSLAILAYFGNIPEQITDYFLKHKTDYEQRFGTIDVTFIMERIASDKFNRAVAEKDEARYNAAVKFAKRHLPSGNADRYVQTYSLELLIVRRAWRSAADLVTEQLRKKLISENRVNYFCWTVYEQCDDKKVIEQAVHLMKNVTDTRPSFALLDTYARLHAKIGHSQEAITAMKRAIAIGKANGEDTKESEEALSKF
jgi:thiol-disulfide isomerase/thioredoxin